MSMTPLKSLNDSGQKNLINNANSSNTIFNVFEDLYIQSKNKDNKKSQPIKIDNSDYKQKISGYFDGQVIKNLPELGAKILFADQNLRNQYYDLRHKIFTEVDERYRAKHPEDCYDWEDYDGSEIRDDVCGRILVATDKEGKVVAGVRFLVSDWIDYTANEDPESGFTIRSFLKNVGLNSEARYVEMEDVVMEKGYRDHALMKEMYLVLISESKKFNCEYAIGVAVKVAARNDKILFSSLGYKGEVFLKYPWIRQKNHGYETRYPAIGYLAQV